MDVVSVDPVVETIDPVAAIPHLAVVFQHFAPVHRKGEQKVCVQMLNYWFHRLYRVRFG